MITTNSHSTLYTARDPQQRSPPQHTRHANSSPHPTLDSCLKQSQSKQIPMATCLSSPYCVCTMIPTYCEFSHITALVTVRACVCACMYVVPAHTSRTIHRRAPSCKKITPTCTCAQSGDAALHTQAQSHIHIFNIVMGVSNNNNKQAYSSHCTALYRCTAQCLAAAARAGGSRNPPPSQSITRPRHPSASLPALSAHKARQRRVPGRPVRYTPRTISFGCRGSPLQPIVSMY
jgi:hypothetical protein